MTWYFPVLISPWENLLRIPKMTILKCGVNFDWMSVTWMILSTIRTNAKLQGPSQLWVLWVRVKKCNEKKIFFFQTPGLFNKIKVWKYNKLEWVIIMNSCSLVSRARDSLRFQKRKRKWMVKFLFIPNWKYCSLFYNHDEKFQIRILQRL